MATNFFELATTLKNLGAKWLSEKKVNFTPWNVLNERWINGPALLRLQKSVWPNQMTSLPTPDEDMECRQIVASVSTVKAKDIIDPSTFSSWRKLIRVTARIRWLAEKIRLRRNAQEGKKDP